MLAKKLKEIGFTDNEAEVYLMLLRVGPSLVSPLAARVKLKRVSIYPVIESLHCRGVITFDKTKKGRYCVALAPETILYALEEEKALLRNKVQIAEACIKELNQTFTSLHEFSAS